MKKILSIICLSMLLISFKTYSQSNLTWTIKDHLEKGAIKTITVFNSNITGFTSKQQAIAFCQKLKATPEVLSCDMISSTETGCDMKLVMKAVHDKRYYAGLASKMGISYVQVNGNKKTPTQWLEKKK